MTGAGPARSPLGPGDSLLRPGSPPLGPGSPPLGPGSSPLGAGPPRSAATEVVHLGRPPRLPGGPVNPPVVISSTFHQGGEPVYGRDGNPTWEALEAAIGGLEGGNALVYASGLAAISAVVECLPVPGRVAVPSDSYNGTRRLLSDLAARGRLEVLTVDQCDTAATLRACEELCPQPGERPSAIGSNGILWLETPANPMLGIADLEALAAGAHRLGMDVVVDNTFACPLLQRPLDFGADVVVHSATKILAGHSDVLMGCVVVRRAEMASALATRRSLHGAIPGAWDAWLALRGVRTLAVRLERAQSNAGELAARLLAHPAVSRVWYPGLPGHEGHELARRQMSGFGTMLSFEVKGGAEDAEAVVASLGLITAGTSLGGVETLIERRGRWAGEEGLPPALLRMSVGIEGVEDIWADLDQALGALG